MPEHQQYSALELIETDLKRPPSPHFGALLVAFGVDEFYTLECLAIRLFRTAGLGVPKGGGFDQPQFDPTQPLYFHDVCQLISMTPEEFQPALAWLLKQCLVGRQDLLVKLREFRDVYREIIRPQDPNLWRAYGCYAKVSLAVEAGLGEEEIEDYLDPGAGWPEILRYLAERRGKVITPRREFEDGDDWEYPIPQTLAYLEHFGLAGDWDELTSRMERAIDAATGQGETRLDKLLRGEFDEEWWLQKWRSRFMIHPGG